MTRRFCFSFYIFTFFFALPVMAGEESSQLRFYDEATRTFIDAPGIATEIDIDVHGTIARTQVIQYFANNTDQWQEGTYTYPLPDDAAVDRLVMVVGDKRILGFVAEKEKARKIYETAKAQGKVTSLVEQHRPNIFKSAVANIPPQSIIAIETAYQHDVKIDSQDFSLRVPLAITPRYDHFSPEDFVAQAFEVFKISEVPVGVEGSGGAHPVVPQSTVARDVAERLSLLDFEGGGNPVALRVSVDPGFVLGQFASAHDIRTDKNDDGIYSVTTKDKILPGEQDFVLQWAPHQKDKALTFLHTETIEGKSYSHLVMVPPVQDVDELSAEEGWVRDVTMIIDVSGSMAGPSLRQAQAALIEAIEDLKPSDYFNVISFESRMDRLFNRTVPATDKNKKKALKWVSGLQATGGTEMMPAVKAALNEPQDKDRLRQIVFITDGAIGYERSLGGYIRDHVGDARFFAVGIGSAPNAHLMRMIAMTGRGTSTFIGDVSETEQKMKALFRKMKAPVLTDIKLTFPDNRIVDVVPRKIPDLLAGEPISLALASGDPLVALNITGWRGAHEWKQHVETGAAQVSEGVSKIYARRKIQDLKFSDPEQKKPETEMRITKLGIEHQIMSDYTSLVAVDEKILRPAHEKLVSVRHDPNLPKGWQLASFNPRAAAAAYDEVLKVQAETEDKAPVNVGSSIKLICRRRLRAGSSNL